MYLHIYNVLYPDNRNILTMYVLGMSQAGTLYNPIQFATTLPESGPIGFVIGAFATGAIDPLTHPYVSQIIFSCIDIMC
jgi:hypothetical protein